MCSQPLPVGVVGDALIDCGAADGNAVKKNEEEKVADWREEKKGRKEDIDDLSNHFFALAFRPPDHLEEVTRATFATLAFIDLPLFFAYRTKGVGNGMRRRKLVDKTGD